MLARLGRTAPSMRSSSVVKTAARLIMLRSAALQLSGPPRSLTCAAMMSLHLRTQGLRPSIPGSKGEPLVMRLFCESFPFLPMRPPT